MFVIVVKEQSVKSLTKEESCLSGEDYNVWKARRICWFMEQEVPQQSSRHCECVGKGDGLYLQSFKARLW